MPARPKLLAIAVVVVALAGGFIWKFGDSTAPPPPDSKQAQEIRTGWHEVANGSLNAMAGRLPGIGAAADGIPTRGTYLVNFWASTCGPCRYEMPWLQRLSATGRVNVLGVTRDNLLSSAQEQLRRDHITYPNLRDEYGDFAFAMKKVVPPQLLPSTIIVRDGLITWAHVGPFHSYDDLVTSVTRRLARPPS